MIKYTRDELMGMPLKVVRGLDIKTIEEERLIQDVVNARTSIAKPVVKFNQIIPDIKNGEQEKEWQAKIDKFNAEHAPVEAKIEEAKKELEVVKEEVKLEKIAEPVVVTIDSMKGEIIKPFCDKCPSKGRLHKKDCPTKQNADKDTVTV